VCLSEKHSSLLKSFSARTLENDLAGVHFEMLRGPLL